MTRQWRNASMILTALIAATAGGCGPKFADDVRAGFGAYNVRKVGLIVQCQQYVASDLRYAQVPDIKPGMKMTRLDEWDAFCSPPVRAAAAQCLREKGYEPLDLSELSPSGRNVRLSDALDAAARAHGELDAVLVIAYVVSPLHVTTVDSQVSVVPGGRQTVTTWRSRTDGLNLAGQVAMIHLASRSTLYSLGSRTRYCYGTCNMPVPGKAGLEERAQIVGARFGTEFGKAEGLRRGLPAAH